MNEVFDRYVADRLRLLAPSTQRQTIGHLKVLREAFGHRVPGEIKPKDVGRFLDVPTALQHRNKIVATLSTVFTCAVTRWYVEGCDSNPCLKVLRHPSKPRDRYISDDEFWAVHAIAHRSVKLAMEIALLTGQRQSDVVQMRWPQINQLYIDVVQGKTGKHLGIKLSNALKESLTRARKTLRPSLFFNNQYHELCYVIKTRHGQPYTPGGFRESWQITMERALRLGVIRERFVFHDIRAKSASDSANLQDAADRLGHSDKALTKRVYDRNIRMVDPLR